MVAVRSERPLKRPLSGNGSLTLPALRAELMHSGDTCLACQFHSSHQSPLCLSLLLCKIRKLGDRLFPELLTTGFQQWAGTGLAQKPFPRPGEGGQCPLLRFLTAWRGGYQRRQFAVAISLMGR